MTPQLQALCLSLSKNSDSLEITVKRYSRTASNKARGYYFGVVLPAIIEQYREKNGEVLTKGDVDLINRQHAYGGEFQTKIIAGQECIVFTELSLSSISKEQFHSFMEKIRTYWAERDITIPEAESNDIRKIKSALSRT